MSLLRSAVLLGAAFLPLVVRAGAVVDLLDAGRTRHSPSIVELLVHGHAHERGVASHVHAAPDGPGRVTPGRASALLTVRGPSGGVPALAVPDRPGSPAADQAIASSPLRHLLLVSLLR